MDRVQELVKQHLPQVVDLRRHLHAHPELSGQEYETQRLVMGELTKLGLNPRKVAGTGIVADLKGGKPGKTVAVRADMDALAIQDKIDKPYRSQNDGVCHACGHDGHTSILVGLAKILATMKEELPGTVRFMFQPSEEAFPGGAEAMVKEGAMDGVDFVIGGHLWQPLPVGVIGTTLGNMMASADEFTLTVQGRGGHGSMPHQTIDPLLTGAEIVVALRTIVGASVSALDAAVLTIGCFRAGDVFNVIPDTAVIKGTVRTFDTSVRDTIFARIEQVAKGICEANGASYAIDKFYGYPPVINNEMVAKTVLGAAEEVLGKDNIQIISPAMGAEDFSYFQMKAPGAFIFIGVGNPEQGIIYPQHHPKYDIDERALGYGLETMARSALKLLQKE